MNKIFIVLVISVLAAGSAVAFDEKTDVMKAVNQFVNGFNKGDTKSAVAACADETSIIDEFPPHEWHGAGACLNWANDYDADAKKNGITDGVVTLGKPRHIDITADRAYVVIPSNYTFKKKGKPFKEPGSMFTFALQKTEAGWRITGWAWAKHQPPATKANERDLRYQIREAGFVPQQRDILYNYIYRDGINDLDQKKSMPFEN